MEGIYGHPVYENCYFYDDNGCLRIICVNNNRNLSAIFEGVIGKVQSYLNNTPVKYVVGGNKSIKFSGITDPRNPKNKGVQLKVESLFSQSGKMGKNLERKVLFENRKHVMSVSENIAFLKS